MPSVTHLALLPRTRSTPATVRWTPACTWAGQLPYANGELLGRGTLGRDVDLETARTLARQAAVNALAVTATAVGGLDRVRVVQMLVFVARPTFGDQSRVADAASELLVDVLGENGRHARTAIGVAGLPRNSPVEIQMICTAATN
jgi:enamine deaminase RidA (YjgF/YER057c/UK114 family)